MPFLLGFTPEPILPLYELCMEPATDAIRQKSTRSLNKSIRSLYVLFYLVGRFA